MPKPHFHLTADHLKLIRHFYVSWNGDENGAPTVDPKRPYGNSYVPPDIIKILGWSSTPQNSDNLCDKAMRLHQELEVALQIVCSHAGEAVEPGLFHQAEEFNARSWRRAGG